MDAHLSQTSPLSQSGLKEIKRYYQKLTWASTTFALLTDLALFCYGGNLKRREKITGRFADILSWLYLVTATLRRFEAEGQPPNDLPLVHWSVQYAFAQIQDGFEGLFQNWDTPIIGSLLQGWVYGWWRMNPLGATPSDRLGHQVAAALQQESETRDRLTTHIYQPTNTTEALGRLEHTFTLVHQADPILQKIKVASQSGQLPKARPETLLSDALTAGIISETELKAASEAAIARYESIQVDAFTLEEYFAIGSS
ncbi:MAG: DUF1974 domain-containing protein [Merismopedia sp. SIO2A8]|nr:DUF1974 domain-containing protein [Symploca sp. SIO2B6]NET48864.1 DUF1974 domain-containing protein [Merismopedia sp. SIO2A8]